MPSEHLISLWMLFDSMYLVQNFSKVHVRLIRLLASILFSFLKVGHYFYIACLLSIFRNFSEVMCSAHENTSIGAFISLWSSSYSPADPIQVPRLVLANMSVTRLTRGNCLKMHAPRLSCQYWIQAVWGAWESTTKVLSSALAGTAQWTECWLVN